MTDEWQSLSGFPSRSFPTPSYLSPSRERDNDREIRETTAKWRQQHQQLHSMPASQKQAFGCISARVWECVCVPVCEWVGGCKSLLPDYLILKTASPIIYEINVYVFVCTRCVFVIFWKLKVRWNYFVSPLDTHFHFSASCYEINEKLATGIMKRLPKKLFPYFISKPAGGY